VKNTKYYAIQGQSRSPSSVSIESPYATCYSLGVTAEALRAIIGWKSAISLQRGPVDPKFQVQGVAATSAILLHSLCKLGLMMFRMV